MRRVLVVLAVLLTIPMIARAGEQLDLTVPETKPAVTTYLVERMTLDWTAQRIDIGLVAPNTGEKKVFSYTDSTATTLMRALNKVDLSVKSLQRRILERLAADGLLGGTVSGTPD